MILRDRYAELSLDGWDAANGGVIEPSRDRDQEREGRGVGGKGGEINTATAATTAIVAKIELVENDLPGGDAVDVTVSSKDTKVRTLYVSEAGRYPVKLSKRHRTADCRVPPLHVSLRF